MASGPFRHDDSSPRPCVASGWWNWEFADLAETGELLGKDMGGCVDELDAALHLTRSCLDVGNQDAMRHVAKRLEELPRENLELIEELLNCDEAIACFEKNKEKEFRSTRVADVNAREDKKMVHQRYKIMMQEFKSEEAPPKGTGKGKKVAAVARFVFQKTSVCCHKES